MNDAAIVELAAEVGAALRRRTMKLATAESCTGGLIAGAITEIAGSSDWFERGMVTYSNEAKEEQLGVPATCIEQFGAVSEPTARAMADGALARSRASITVAVTGVAGPGGGTPKKPVGTVHIATARSNHGLSHRQEFFELNERIEIQLAAVQSALEMLRERMT